MDLSKLMQTTYISVTPHKLHLPHHQAFLIPNSFQGNFPDLVSGIVNSKDFCIHFHKVRLVTIMLLYISPFMQQVKIHFICTVGERQNDFGQNVFSSEHVSFEDGKKVPPFEESIMLNITKHTLPLTHRLPAFGMGQ